MTSIRVDFFFLLLFSVTYLFCFSDAQCNLYISSNSGFDGPSCGINDSSPCRSLNQTIKLINSSCTATNIFVYPGTYSGYLNRGVQFLFLGSSLRILPWPSSSGSVIFDGESQSFIMSIDLNNGTVSIQNITFTGGYHESMHAGALTITYRFHGGYQIINSKFINCNGFDAGGVYASADLLSIVDSCEFINCSGNNGGGASLLGGNINIASTNFTQNSATEFGGGLNIDADFLLLQLCNFKNNTSTRGGGCSITSSVKIESTQFYYNTATIDGGGAIYLFQPETSTFSSVEIVGNQAYTGGGIYIQALPTISQLVISNSLIHDNVAKSLGGGAYLSEAYNVSINNLVCEDNRAVMGGGLYIKSINSIQLYTCSIRQNLASDKGGGLACDSTNQVTAEGLFFFGNTAFDCAYSDHTGNIGSCPGIFKLCALKQSMLDCSTCAGLNCLQDSNKTYHCFSNNSQNCICPFSQSPAPSPSEIPSPISYFPPPLSPHGPPATSAGTIAGIVIGVLAGVVVLLGVGYYCRVKLSTKSTDYVPVR